MKYIIRFIFLVLIVSSCSKEEPILLDMKVAPEDITKIELRGDHKTLLPNGVSKMGFNVVAYSRKKVKQYITNDDGLFETVVNDVEEVIPSDRIPEGLIKVCEESGTELKDNIYSATTEKPGIIKKFYAKCGNLRSNELLITIRELPDESYEEVVVPVVFHVISLPATAGPTYDVSTEYLEEQLKMVSDIFNAKITSDPNAGNAKMTFKLAEYDPNGNKMQSVGRTSYTLSSAEFKTVDGLSSSSKRLEAYKAILMNKKSTLIFEPSKYLNVWLVKFSTSTGITESSKYLTPSIMHTSYDFGTIPGIVFAKAADTFTKEDMTDCLQAGVIVNFTPFYRPSAQGENEFNFATTVAWYYGILNTQCDKYSKLNADGDSDYCPDTYSYDYGYYPIVYKANNLDGQPEICPERPMEYFTSFNIMDRYSRKNSISVDQVKRLRKVLEQCPERYAYKSDFAFKGK